MTARTCWVLGVGYVEMPKLRAFVRSQAGVSDLISSVEGRGQGTRNVGRWGASPPVVPSQDPSGVWHGPLDICFLREKSTVHFYRGWNCHSPLHTSCSPLSPCPLHLRLLFVSNAISLRRWFFVGWSGEIAHLFGCRRRHISRPIPLTQWDAARRPKSTIPTTPCTLDAVRYEFTISTTPNPFTPTPEICDTDGATNLRY